MEQRGNKSMINLRGGKDRQSSHFLANLDLPSIESALNYTNFHLTCGALFPPEEIKQNDWRIKNIFELLDNDCDGILKGQEIKIFHDWLRTIVEPVSALLIVDVQNDFITGSLALRNCGCNQDGLDVVGPINRLTKNGQFDEIIYTLDWHPENHISFHENLHLRELHLDSKVTKENAKLFDTVIFAEPYLEQILWPKHCVMDTWGSRLHKDLVIAPDSKQLRKGLNPDVEVYSIFGEKDATDSNEVHRILHESGVTQVFVGGIAYDVCVKATCLDALRLGYSVAVIDDCCRGVDVNGIQATRRLITENDGLVINSDDVLSLVNREKRSLIMSHKSAKTMASIAFHRTNANVFD